MFAFIFVSRSPLEPLTVLPLIPLRLLTTSSVTFFHSASVVTVDGHECCGGYSIRVVNIFQLGVVQWVLYKSKVVAVYMDWSCCDQFRHLFA